MNSLLGVLFNIPSRYSFPIGLNEYLGLEVDGSQLQIQFPMNPTPDTVTIFLNSPNALRPLVVTCLDLSEWERPPAAISGVFSGQLASITIGAATPEINVTIGTEGTHIASLPTGSTTIAAAAAALEASIRNAAPPRGFTGTRVIPVGNQLLVIPGIRGAAINFSGTPADASTVTNLKLAAAAVSVASGVMSGDLSDFPKTFPVPPRLEVTIGLNPARGVVLTAAPTSIADAASKIATALTSSAFPEFAGAQVIVIGTRLLILPGVAGALVRVRTTTADPTTAELLKLTNKTGVDVSLGRFAFAIGDEPAAGTTVQVAYNYGFSADLGGGPYDRRERPRPLGQAGRERPDTIGFPDGMGKFKLIRVPGDAPTISGAVAGWNAAADPHVVIQIEDSRSYTENISIAAPPDGEIILQAMNQTRPTLIGNIDVNASGGQGRFQVNGFCVAGRLSVHGSLGELKLMHSTLVPGLALDESGAPVSPDSASLEIDASNDRLQVIIGHCITGSLQIPYQVVSLDVRDSIIDTSRKEGRAIQAPASRRSAQLAEPQTAVLRPGADFRARLRPPGLLQNRCAAPAGVRRSHDVRVLRVFAAAQPANPARILRGWHLDRQCLHSLSRGRRHQLAREQAAGDADRDFAAPESGAPPGGTGRELRRRAPPAARQDRPARYQFHWNGAGPGGSRRAGGDLSVD